MKKVVLVFTLFLLGIFFAISQNFNTNQTVFSEEDGLSGDYITGLLQDKKGFIWIGTQSGLNKYDGNKFVSFTNLPNDSLSLSNNSINAIAEDKEGNIWVATEGGGVSKFNPISETFQSYLQKETDSTLISHNYVSSIFIDSENRIWAGHWEGLDLYHPEKDRFERVLEPKLPKNRYAYWTLNICEDQEQNLWLATDGSGAVKFNTHSMQIEKYHTLSEETIENSDSGESIKSVVFNNGVLWFSGNSGVGYVDTNSQGKVVLLKNALEDHKNNISNKYHLFKSNSGRIFFHEVFNGNLKEIKKDSLNNFIIEQQLKLETGISILSFLEDDAGSFWLGSNKLIYTGAHIKPFSFYTNFKKKTATTKKLPSSYYVLFEDSKGRIWFEDHDEGLMSINPKNGEKKTYPKVSSKFIKKEIGSSLNDITEDSDGNIWLFLHGQIISLNPESGKYQIFDSFIVKNNGSPAMVDYQGGIFDKNGVLWIPVNSGFLIGQGKKGWIDQDYRHYGMNLNGAHPMPGYYTNIVFEDLSGNLFVGYEDEGLHTLDTETHQFTKINYEIPGLNNTNAKQVLSLYQNQKNILWIGTASGLFKYNTNTKTSIQYGVNGDMPDPYIKDILDDGLGNLWLTTNKGLTKFTPKTEALKNYNKKDGLGQNSFYWQASFKSDFSNLIYLTGKRGVTVFDPYKIKSNQHIPKIGFTNFEKHNAKGEFTTVAGINYLNDLELPFNERDFTIEIAALDFTNPVKNHYAYWLEGYNTNWVEIGTRREVTFTNLSPGSYTLRVKGSNNDGIWNETGKSLQIIILPPWWGTWWAYTLYAFAFLSLLYGIYTYRINKLETKRLKELDIAKRTMYTNITHEFRTPLTVISGINKELREQTKGEYNHYFDLIERSSKNMLQLVNQLLELRKLEIGKMKIDYIQDNIISYLKYIVETFQAYAKTKGISLHFVCITEEIVMDYDPDKILMILSNLLSNAIKYSPPESDVYFQIDELPNQIKIRIIDSGKGIPEEQIAHIFDRFYKIQNKDQDNVDGVGIGLAVTKELVELLQGEINVSSKIEQGSIFTLILPIHKNAPLAIESTKLAIKTKVFEDFNIQKNFKKPKIIPASQNALHLLIIEDNPNIVDYLMNCLRLKWNLEIANDGQKGIDQAIENIPDIILCDLMMPNVDGFKVLEVLKNDIKTSHIPIVILSAKADDESRIEAYKKGADSYLLKPFNKEELLIILEKQVEQRKLLQEHYKVQTSLKFIDNKEIHKEDLFIQKLESLVFSEDSKDSNSIHGLCVNLGMSRTQLHHKIKALTGKSTSIFVRSLRLQKGKYLLEHTNKGISEIAYDVGFNNPSYFTKSFTEEFGLPPSSLRK
ncbi:two-component regulator propeller domain-containing protein [Ascidiimonas sp. W6]|uniref:two-component regulator propeller domain-containing protein n=1 Tax=Ascidiimonas meishanensis TaxID=3128903 RepID=UPI0030EDBE6F